MIFRQLFEPVSSTYTYLLGCDETGQAMLIDPVVTAIDRYLQELQRLGLNLVYAIDSHIHADHITAAFELRKRVGSKIAAPAMNQLPCADLGIEHGAPVTVGSIKVLPLHTPGHTDDHFVYAMDDRVFTGDALLIDGCGRTDFQNGDARVLYRSVTDHLFTLADDVLVYPGHDYHQRRVSTIGQEKARNPRLGNSRDMESFVALMANLDLPYPKFMDYAVPANRACGTCPSNLPEELAAHCEPIMKTPQG
jgi:sulfur dioxygenase